jgi:hypothetical protein
MISIDIEALKREYLFANTAAQLYRHFRENISLQNLAKTERPEILVEEYKKRTEKDERSIEDVVEAYAILMAVTFYDYKVAMKTFKKFDLSKLEWGEELADMYRREARITIYRTEHGKGQVLKEVYTRTSGTASYITGQGRGVLGDYKQTESETSNAVLSTFMPTNKSAKGR